MAITIFTADPAALLAGIKSKIDANTIRTWSYDSDGDFTHTADQWLRQAWLVPEIQEGRLVFYILPPKSKTLSKTTYGIYHGRFVEMVLTHFDTSFSSAVASAMARGRDRVTA